MSLLSFWYFLMFNRVFYKLFITSNVFALLATVATAVLAESDAYQTMPRYAPQVIDDSERTFHRPKSKKYGDISGYWSQPKEKKQLERYVTPEIIESLNRQEAYMQQTQTDSLQQRATKSQSNSNQQSHWYQQNLQQYPAYPSYGMGRADPVYGVPSVSPWGNAADVINRREQFSWMPNEAVGGVPPIHVPPYSGDSLNRIDGPGGDEVFNPFTFLQNEN